LGEEMKEMMTTTINIPDRFRLILQFVVFSLGGALLFLLILMFSGFFAHFQNTNIRNTLVLLVAISIALNSWRLVIQWKRLKKQEEAGEIPDYQNKQNITPTQLILVCVIIVLLLGGYTVDQLYWKGAWKICVTISIAAAVGELLFLKRIRVKDSQVK
jgi:amino acid transporter